jgi:hypothetical protein
MVIRKGQIQNENVREGIYSTRNSQVSNVRKETMGYTKI